jgi:multicomponent Na+:H+ antiporter subunit E
VFVFAIWLLLTWSVEPAALLAGLIFSLLVSVLLSRTFPDRLERFLDPRRWFWLLVYIPYFFYYCVKANVDVAYRVLNPDMPIRPGIVKVRTELKTDIGKTMLANSITLTPGTLTVDIDGQDLYIHWIYVATDDPRRQTDVIVRRFERVIKEVCE